MNRRHYLTTTASAAVLGLAGCTGSNNEAVTQTTAEQTTEPITTPRTSTHEIGDQFAVGTGAHTVQYRVTNLQFAKHIGSPDLYTESDGVFAVITLTLENAASKTIDITPSHLQLVDADDRRFDPDTDALSYAVNDDRLPADAIRFDQLQPGLEVTRTVIYDVPAGVGYGLLVQPVGVGSQARSHVVVLGEVPSEDG